MKLSIGHIINEEWRNIFSDKRLFAVLFLIPILYTAMFGYLYSDHRVAEMDTVIVDQDHSQLSQKIVQAFDETESFNVIQLLNSEAEIQPLLEAGKAKVAIVIPNNMFNKVLRGEEAPILTMIDGSNMLISNAATKAANEVIANFNFGTAAKKLAQNEFNSEQIQLTFQSIPFRTRVLYNGTFNYSTFLVYGLMGVALQQVLLLGLSLTVTRDKEKGNWNRFKEWRECPWRIAYAKSAPYFLIGIFNFITTFLVAIYGFGLPSNGSLFSAMGLAVSFTFALLGIGYLSSLFSANQVGATQITMLIAVPSFLLSGFTWPFEAMPKLISVIGHLLPLTYFVDGVRNIFIKGVGFELIWKDCLILLLMGLCTFFIAFIASSLKVFWEKGEKDVKNDIEIAG
ncbi:MAG TPA: ABC transporter permease [Bacillales bacterium]|nr:ABC transporter permease [Bacillales bacterium]